jgi:hypothetical protein
MYQFKSDLLDSDRFPVGIFPAPGLSESDKAYIARLYPMS